MNNFNEVTRALATAVRNLLMNNHVVIPPGVICHIIDRYTVEPISQPASQPVSEPSGEQRSRSLIRACHQRQWSRSHQPRPLSVRQRLGPCNRPRDESDEWHDEDMQRRYADYLVKTKRPENDESQ